MVKARYLTGIAACLLVGMSVVGCNSSSSAPPPANTKFSNDAAPPSGDAAGPSAGKQGVKGAQATIPKGMTGSVSDTNVNAGPGN